MVKWGQREKANRYNSNIYVGESQKVKQSLDEVDAERTSERISTKKIQENNAICLWISFSTWADRIQPIRWRSVRCSRSVQFRQIEFSHRNINNCFSYEKPTLALCYTYNTYRCDRFMKCVSVASLMFIRCLFFIFYIEYPVLFCIYMRA